MKKSRNLKNKGSLYKFGILITVLFEILLYFIFICGILGTILSFIFIWIYYFEHSCGLSDAVSAFGVFATVFIIPFISILASLMFSYKSTISEIENDLAKCQCITLKFKKLPEGADLASARLLQAAIYEEYMIRKEAKIEECAMPTKTLRDYYYLMCLNFKQDISEFYKIALCDMDLTTLHVGASKTLNLRSIKNTDAVPCIIKDVSGIDSLNEGEQIYIFMERQDKETKENEISMMLAGKNNDANDFLLKRYLRCTLNFTPKDSSRHGKLLFPITRKLSSQFLIWTLRRRQVELELEFRLSKNDYGIIDTQILDVSFKICKNLEWAKYIKFKSKIVDKF